MSKIKDEKISVNQLLQVIPESLLSHLAETTNLDYYTKILNGKKLFYLLLYGILENDKLSQRGLEASFNDPLFKHLFNLPMDETIRHSSLSERLSKIDPVFFLQAYLCIHEQFSSLYSSADGLGYNLVRVDSTMVSDVSGRIVMGIDNKRGKKAIKYSIATDGFLACDVKVFNETLYGGEENTLPSVILGLAMKDKHHRNVYVFDRGVQSARTMAQFCRRDITFIVRCRENRKFVEIEDLGKRGKSLGNLKLVKDCKVYLNTNRPVEGASGKKYRKVEMVTEPFRLVIARDKKDPGMVFRFLTNDFNASAREIANAYRKRWDIEVFFRFLKQELSANHLVSLNKNGIEVIIYMTLIVSMLTLMYKKINGVTYSMAKRMVKMQIRNLGIAIVVVECGGDPDKFLREKDDPVKRRSS